MGLFLRFWGLVFKAYNVSLFRMYLGLKRNPIPIHKYFKAYVCVCVCTLTYQKPTLL